MGVYKIPEAKETVAQAAEVYGFTSRWVDLTTRSLKRVHSWEITEDIGSAIGAELTKQGFVPGYRLLSQDECNQGSWKYNSDFLYFDFCGMNIETHKEIVPLYRVISDGIHRLDNGSTLYLGKLGGYMFIDQWGNNHCAHPRPIRRDRGWGIYSPQLSWHEHFKDWFIAKFQPVLFQPEDAGEC